MTPPPWRAPPWPTGSICTSKEYCPGTTLRDAIDKRMFEHDPDELWWLFRQLLEAVAYIHGEDIVHRDLKPANVFLKSDPVTNKFTVKLGDFGLAVLSSSKSAVAVGAGDAAGGAEGDSQAVGHMGSASDLENPVLPRQDPIANRVGTSFYAAPEQDQAYDRADSYSLGIILFELQYPFGSLMERALQLEEIRSTGKVPNEFLVGRPDRLSAIKVVIESLLKHDPAERPTAAELLKSGLIPLKVEKADKNAIQHGVHKDEPEAQQQPLQSSHATAPSIETNGQAINNRESPKVSQESDRHAECVTEAELPFSEVPEIGRKRPRGLNGEADR